ncbi:MAG TPA: FkbM family methyltransferase [Myxococcota bacterium]|nr:FkbM family methyltransferase [Myxococcota bacterium]
MNPLRALRYARSYRNWRELARERAAGRKPRRAVLRDGTVFEAPEGANALRVVAPVFHRNVYTPPGLEVRPDDCVVDVGAHIGAFAVFAAQRTRGRVLAIEPHPANAEYLRRNLRANGAAHAEVAECAVSDTSGVRPLRLGASGTTHRLAVPGTALAGASLDVSVATLPELLAKHGLERVDFLKLDCEGEEGRILPALPAAVSAGLRAISLEFHDDLSPLDHAALEQLLATRGFRVARVWDGRSKNGMLFAHR